MKKLLIVLGIIVAITATVIVSVRQSSRRGTKVYEEEVKSVERLVSTVKASGEIQPRVFVNISSQVPGEIVRLRVKEGDQVRKGEILVQLDPEQYRSNVARLEANLRLARINLEREQTALATHENTLKRQQALSKQQIVSDESLEQTRLQYDTSRIQVSAYEEQIRQAEADLTKARDELAKTTLKAPMDGLITRVNAKEGEQVIIGTMNNPGTVILVLSDMSGLLAEVRVDETEVTSVRPGQKATVTVDAVESRLFEGAVTEIAHTAIKERDVSRFTVKISLSEKPGGQGPPIARELPPPVETDAAPGLSALRPGMSAHAAIEVASRSDVLVVPIQAVIEKSREEFEKALDRRDDEGTGGGLAAEEGAAAATPPVSGAGTEELDVIFLDRDGVAEMIRVRTGLSDEFQVEILEPVLQPGDKIVVGPYRTLKKLKHGDRLVRVEKDEELQDEG